MWQVIHVLLVTYDDNYHSVVPNGVWHFRAKIIKTFYENNVITETDMTLSSFLRGTVMEFFIMFPMVSNLLRVMILSWDLNLWTSARVTELSREKLGFLFFSFSLCDLLFG